MRTAVTSLITSATLGLALAGPPLLTIVASRVAGDSTNIATLLPFDLMFWAVLAIVLIVVVRVEKQPLASIGFRRPRWSTLVWGLLLLVGINFTLAPATMWVVNRAGIAGYEHGIARLLVLPAWYRVFLAVSAGVVEETLYRGYAVERLASLSGSYLAGGSIAVVAFAAAHLPAWGMGPSLVFLVDAAAATLFYVWKRDLLALIIAHAAGDTIGLVVLPP